jgi:hypothetical protein
MLIIFVLFLILSVITYDSFKRSNNSLAIGVTRIIVLILDIGFLIGLLLYYNIRSIQVIFFSILFPLYLFMAVYGVDIPILLKIIVGILFIVWFRHIWKNKNNN